MNENGEHFEFSVKLINFDEMYFFFFAMSKLGKIASFFKK